MTRTNSAAATSPSLDDRFAGCLLGLAVGDALGARFEGKSPEHIAGRGISVEALVGARSAGVLSYTDDTQMAIGVAETLVACRGIDEEEICKRFAANYERHRGYGRGARLVLEAMIEGQDHRRLAESHFPGGSFGNGAAMRVAPVGLMFRDDLEMLWHQARLSALPTHMHPLGIEGAQVLALAVALAASSEAIEREPFFETLAARCESMEYAGPLRRAAKIDDPKDLALFGNGIEATASVVTAIASFALTPHSYAHTVGHVIRLGGDTDTIAAMAGALSGAFLGKAAIPPHWLSSLEDGQRGKSYLEKLAEELLVV